MEKREIIKRLESIGLLAYKQLARGDFPTLEYPKLSKENIIYEPDKGYRLGSLKSKISAGDMSQVALWARLIWVATIAKQAVLQNKVITLRELFYMAISAPPPLNIPKKIGNQTGQVYTNKLIELLELITGVPREDLGFRAKQRCAIFGDITINIEGKRVNALNAGSEGVTIPGSLVNTRIIEVNVPYVFVLEADASFTRLVEAIRSKKLNAAALYLGGYAPRSVIDFLRQISEKSDARLLCITDLDFHGLNIYVTTAKYSVSSAHLPNHCVPTLEFFGVSAADAVEHFKKYPQAFEDAKKSDINLAKKALKDLEAGKDLRWSDPEVKESLEFIVNKQKVVEAQAFAVKGLDAFVDEYIVPKLRKMR